MTDRSQNRSNPEGVPAASRLHSQSLHREDIERVLKLSGLDAKDLEQPLVFFRDGWDFRWLSRAAVIARLGSEELESVSINGSRAGEVDSPPELDDFLEALGALVQNAPQHGGTADVEGLVAELQPGRPASRDVLVLPGGWHRDDTWCALRLALGLGAAMILPPEEGAFAWTTLWSRPTLLVAADDQLVALDEELQEKGRRKQRRALAKLRAVIPSGVVSLSSLRSLNNALPDQCRRLPALQPNTGSST